MQGTIVGGHIAKGNIHATSTNTSHSEWDHSTRLEDTVEGKLRVLLMKQLLLLLLETDLATAAAAILTKINPK